MSQQTPQFVDFELLVGVARKPGEYPVTIITAQAGEANGTLKLAPDVPEIKSALNAIANRETSDDLLQQFGGRLFEALFAETIGRVYEKSLGLAKGANKRLRLRLRIEPPDISALPWEFLYNSQADLFLALSPNQCLSRYIPVNELVLVQEVQRPLRVLVVVSNPSDLQDQGLPPLKADEEISRIQKALEKRESAGEVKTEVLHHAIAADLREKLRTFRPHVVHFIGHGGFRNNQGMLVMEDDDQRARLVSDKQFREFFLGADDTRLVILNACQGATQSSALALAGLAPQVVRRGLGAVVAMQYPIPDDVALSFAREFYRALAQYYPVDAAVTEGRRAVYQDFGSDQPDWGTPVIFMRSPDGMLFSPPSREDLGSQAPAAAAGVNVSVGGAGANFQGAQIRIGDTAGDITKTDSVASIADWSPQQLRDVLSSRFDLEELRTLCFDMSVDFDSLPGEGKAAKARELVAYMQRRGRLPELVTSVHRARRDIQW